MARHGAIEGFDRSDRSGRRHKSNVFFFQAEDGIRAADVTGVQTCAFRSLGQSTVPERIAYAREPSKLPVVLSADEVGRASCRERVWLSVGGVSLKKNG